jgi:hypothetical protein
MLPVCETANWARQYAETIDETVDKARCVHFCYRLRQQVYKMAAFDRPITLESHGIAVALCPSGKFPSGKKCHANKKSHKIVKARLASCFLD